MVAAQTQRQLRDSSQGAAKHFAASRAVPLCRRLVAGSSHGQQMSGTGALNAACVYAEAGDAAEDTVAEVCRILRLALGQTATIEACAMRCEDVHARARSSQVRPDLGGGGGWGTPNTAAPSPSLTQPTHAYIHPIRQSSHIVIDCLYTCITCPRKHIHIHTKQTTWIFTSLSLPPLALAADCIHTRPKAVVLHLFCFSACATRSTR